eukprot:tig00001049_g6667.t1
MEEGLASRAQSRLEPLSNGFKPLGALAVQRDSIGAGRQAVDLHFNVAQRFSRLQNARQVSSKTAASELGQVADEIIRERLHAGPGQMTVHTRA